MPNRALIVIDIQNDYFPGGRFPLWNPEGTLASIEAAIARAKAAGVAVVLVQHIANPSRGPAPFFNKGTEGAALHPRLLAVAPDAPVVVKDHADSFFGTNLEATLQQLGATELLICGMMTQNCVTHTAISKSAEKYKVTVLADCCTTVSQMIHLIALNGMSTRVPAVNAETVL